ncbi:hypothetical protein BHE74_00005458 [Ensete ventricosum]|nr:hypothetical protein BHE74_00005458 [Ensete ventricosum]
MTRGKSDGFNPSVGDHGTAKKEVSGSSSVSPPLPTKRAPESSRYGSHTTSVAVRSNHITVQISQLSSRRHRFPFPLWRSLYFLRMTTSRKVAASPITPSLLSLRDVCPSQPKAETSDPTQCRCSRYSILFFFLVIGARHDYLELIRFQDLEPWFFLNRFRDHLHAFSGKKSRFFFPLGFLSFDRGIEGVCCRVVAIEETVSASMSTASCAGEAADECWDDAAALTLKLVAIVAILVAGVVGVAIPLAGRKRRLLRTDGGVFVCAKAFAAGVILATGFVHMLHDAQSALTSPCLPTSPWRRFPFPGFVAMAAALGTLVLDFAATQFYERKHREEAAGVKAAAAAAVAPTSADEEESGITVVLSVAPDSDAGSEKDPMHIVGMHAHAAGHRHRHAHAHAHEEGDHVRHVVASQVVISHALNSHP